MSPVAAIVIEEGTIPGGRLGWRTGLAPCGAWRWRWRLALAYRSDRGRTRAWTCYRAGGSGT